MEDDKKLIMPFGKHEGEYLEDIIMIDPKYVKWLTNQNWVETRFNSLFKKAKSLSEEEGID